MVTGRADIAAHLNDEIAINDRVRVRHDILVRERGGVQRAEVAYERSDAENKRGVKNRVVEQTGFSQVSWVIVKKSPDARLEYLLLFLRCKIE